MTQTPDTDIQAVDPTLSIIGIGSSAGGLEAIRQFVHGLPTDLPVSYVVAQHMSPHHKSLMTALVARDTQLEVCDVEDKTVPKANTIYITPPKKDIIFENGILRLLEPSSAASSPKPSVDRFLTSLAQELGEKSIGIILSGTGSDGSYGVQAIREAGGITMAQDNDSAKYDGMPQSAVQTGCVDLILTPEAMSQHLPRILTSPRDFSEIRSDTLPVGPHSDLLQILLARTQVDFRDYKPTTLLRRIERRMVALNIQSEEEYTQFCRNNPSAVDALFKDLLISVTRFFRDREAFQQLAALLPNLIEQAKGDQIRIWIAGCATGEEAYSIAMLMCEALGCDVAEFKSLVQIFATDIDKDALSVARKGSYSLFALNDIPEEYASKYLIRQNDGVRVIDSLRRAILFSDHNVCQSPPFQRIDLVCCRNLLIYFSNSLQKKVVERFHYAMSDHALMFLGTAESIAGSDDLFVPDSKAAHVFRKRALGKASLNSYSMPSPPSKPRGKLATVQHGISTDRQLLQALAQSLGENSILVADDYSISEVFGDVSPYISLSNTTNLRMNLDLLRPPLREEARSLITIALKNGKKRSGVRHLLAENQVDHIRLDVFPIIAKAINERAALVVFTQIAVLDVDRDAARIKAGEGAGADERIVVLQNEVTATREALQQTIEELETSNEELQSVNEELQSTNEELQATNEELETSNEELQSTNEELLTVNEELQITATELTERSSELASVLESTPLPIVVTDTALQVTQSTSAAMDLFSMKTPLSNPHVSQCILPEGYPPLAPLCSEALRLGHMVSKEFNSKGAHVSLQCSPYFNAHGQVGGVTIVAVVFPGLALEMKLILSNEKIYINHRREDGTILRISDALAAMFNHRPEDMIGKNLNDFLGDAPDQIDYTEYSTDLLDVKTGKVSTDNRIIQFTPVGETDPSWHSIHSIPYQDPVSGLPTIYSIGIDVTSTIRKQIKDQALAATQRLVQDMAAVGNWTVDLVENTVIWSPEVHRLHGTDPKRYVPDVAAGIEFYHEDDRDDVAAMIEDAIANAKEFRFRKRLVAVNGTVVNVEAFGAPIVDALGNVTKIVGVFREVRD